MGKKTANAILVPEAAHQPNATQDQSLSLAPLPSQTTASTSLFSTLFSTEEPKKEWHVQPQNFLFLIPTVTGIALGIPFVPHFAFGLAAGAGMLVAHLAVDKVLTDCKLIEEIKEKNSKYKPLIDSIAARGWKVNPLVIITAGARATTHIPSMKLLVDNFNIPMTTIKNTFKNINTIAIQYAMSILLHKRRIENHQPLPVTLDPP